MVISRRMESEYYDRAKEIERENGQSGLGERRHDSLGTSCMPRMSCGNSESPTPCRSQKITCVDARGI